MIYGGGFVAGSKSSKARFESLALKLGFVVVVPNYCHCPTVSIYEGPLTDIHVCYSWVHETLSKILRDDTGITFDGNRITVIGSSVGGTLALLFVRVY